jgi:5-methylcytosine-specific restriction protein A
VSRARPSKAPQFATLAPLVQRADLLIAKPAPSAAGSWRTGMSSAAERGYGYRWQQARARFLREHPLCCYCEREGRVTAATVVDHHIPHRGDEKLFWDQNNWRALCKRHHDSDAQKKDRA